MTEFNSQDRIITYIDDDGNTLQEVLISSGILKIDNTEVLSITPSGDIQFSNPVLLDLGSPTSSSSAVSKDYVDTISGSITTDFENQDLSMSGILQNNINTKVSKSGDVMSGNLTLSGSNILTTSSGIGNVGAINSPLNNAYVNSFYDKGIDPTEDNQLINKQYLENQLLQGTKQAFSYVFTASTNYYTSVNSSTLTVVGHLIFRGSDLVGIPTSIKAILGHSSNGVQFQLFDLTNNAIICSVTTTNAGPTLIDCGIISNIPTTEATWQFRLRRTGNNGQGRIYALDIRV